MSRFKFEIPKVKNKNCIKMFVLMQNVYDNNLHFFKSKSLETR